jgi:murein DD-endopeptidase MepM/ murein hydrolase activator NlpD
MKGMLPGGFACIAVIGVTTLFLIKPVDTVFSGAGAAAAEPLYQAPGEYRNPYQSAGFFDIRMEQHDRSTWIFVASNRTPSPHQVELRIYSQETGNEIRPVMYKVVPPNANHFVIGSHKVEPGSPAFRYNFRYFFGDPDQTRHRDDHVYMLPWRHGETYRVIQGYNGAFSHQNQYSIDFDMPEGTPVYAARDGFVIDVKDDSNRGGPDPAYRDDGNYIAVLHEDGTFAEYVHLRFRGSRVRVGDRVRAGDPIGYSGNTGFSTTPHLHFSVKVPAYMRYSTTPTLFRLGNQQAGRLAEGESYRAVHY